MRVPADARHALLAIARASLEARVLGRARPVLPEPDLAASGVFVTVHVGGDLRGCLGSLDAREPVARAVARLASDVAYMDTRFAPIREDEVPSVRLEISVLSPRRRVGDPSGLQVGRDGLIVEQGHRRGLLLPQVAVEHGWDATTFLAHACLKAGLPRDAWATGASVYGFEADVFGEPAAARPARGADGATSRRGRG